MLASAKVKPKAKAKKAAKKRPVGRGAAIGLEGMKMTAKQSRVMEIAGSLEQTD